jgi:hypothetical protein
MRELRSNEKALGINAGGVALGIAQRPAFLRSAGVAIVIAALGFSPSARAQSFKSRFSAARCR